MSCFIPQAQMPKSVYFLLSKGCEMQPPPGSGIVVTAFALDKRGRKAVRGTHFHVCFGRNTAYVSASFHGGGKKPTVSATSEKRFPEGSQPPP